MSSPLQIAVLVLLGAALWSIFYIVSVLSQDREKPRPQRRSARRTLQERQNQRTMDA